MYLTKSSNVSAVKTCLVVPLPANDEISLPAPGRIVQTKIIPNMTAHTVVVK